MQGMLSFRLLKAVAAIVSFALLMWGAGAHTTSLVDAASIADVSNTLSDSEPDVVIKSHHYLYHANWYCQW